ncbi:MAG: aminopeptidase P family protein [Micavibrio aeruginosavorus]|uniref:Aminopeptidase P family protein n=1 Tax=Micavibrio aeruginosavorus TaxID=349221 RepID=A0A7T5UH14_9BACT|nr:MAG: aminopeptidase P family protein [Micavibrio aeruginosavorus]
MDQIDRLNALRAQLAAHSLDGFLVPKADEFQGEYIPARAERLAWLTDFTGSAGAAVVLKDRAMIESDSRYRVQIKKQVDATLFDIVEGSHQELGDWVVQNAQDGAVIGYDPKLHTPAQISALDAILKSKNIALKPVDKNLIDLIWHNQPGPPLQLVEVFSEQTAGRTAQEKREDIAASVMKNGGVASVVTMPDSIAWMLNIRGTDVPHTPFALSNAIIHANGDVDWFIDTAKIPGDVRAHLGNRVQILPPDTLGDALTALALKSAQEKKPVLFDHKNGSIWFKQVIEAAGGKLKDVEDLCLLPKACKTPAEQQSIRAAHVRDGVAETKFLCWFDREVVKGQLTELTVAEKLEDFRRQQAGFRDTSFDTIAGWNANGAIVHYRATPEDHAAIVPPGILLLDSGAQYNDGTTDITRTIAVGEPTAEQKKANTLVLKGHIAIAAAVFPEGTRGADIDMLARQPLMRHKMNYGHGTGHGVGIYLSVHEQGGGVSKAAMRPYKPGMLISNEPGYYKEGSFGIRIENLVMVVEDGVIDDGRQTPALRFETVTLVPIDKRLIDISLLNDDEIVWLNDYHARVEREIGPYLDATERTWLKEACAPLKKPDAAGPKPRTRRQKTPGPSQP